MIEFNLNKPEKDKVDESLDDSELATMGVLDIKSAHAKPEELSKKNKNA